jgi:hypothetical protein
MANDELEKALGHTTKLFLNKCLRTLRRICLIIYQLTASLGYISVETKT